MKSKSGFTLIELVVVVAIIAILAVIVVPGYLSQVRKSRRNAVEVAVQQIALMEERFRADCPKYTAVAFAAQSTPVNCAADSVGQNPYNPTTKYYAISIPSATTVAYQIQAVAVPTLSQANDHAFDGADCSTLAYSFTSGVLSKTPASCWNQ